MEQELRQLEESLWIEVTRFDRDYMEKVLAVDFFEFGRSGKMYTRAETLAAGREAIKATLPLENFKIHTVSEDTVLITYISEVQYETLERANRSSLWIKTSDGWKLKFHQGTPI